MTVRGLESVDQQTMLSSWYRSSKNLFKGDWSLAKPNMASGNAQTVPNLCATTVHVHQD